MIDLDALSKTFTQLMTESLLLRGVDQHNRLKHESLCVGLTAVKERWELLYMPAFNLRLVREHMDNDSTAAKTVDAALYGMESVLELLRQDFYNELQRIRPLIEQANAAG